MTPAPAPQPARAPAGAIVQNPRAPGRETIESIVVAFTLALLFRTFEAEAFVIPTGSMAPTLMGRHKDLACESCGREFRVGCSAEEDEDAQRKRGELAALEAGNRDPARAARLRMALGDKLVARARCPNCGHTTQLIDGEGRDRRYDPRYPSFSGDRILVDKFAYDFASPRRWDVAVFKYPEEAKTNYIKRLVGLPGETLSISGGDIWTARDAGPPAIARKPTDRLRAMLQLVHDSRHVSPALVAAGWPTAWTNWSQDGGGWTTDDLGRSFGVTLAADDSATLRYRHLIPSPDTWQAVASGADVSGAATPQLVGDFQPYNADSLGPHWVGDLAVEVDLESRGTAGSVTLDLVEAGAVHRCTIDLADGTATIRSDGLGDAAPRAATRVRGRGSWTLLFANVDDALTLFVDGRPVTFTGDTRRERTLEEALEERPVTEGGRPGGPVDDLSPAGVTATAADVRLARLRLHRDVYYVASGELMAMTGRAPEERVLSFVIGPDEYFMLGDNSSASKDSRAWDKVHAVHRSLMVGRALVVFWPHMIPASWSVPLRFRGQEVRLPSWPNFARMTFVR